MLLNRLLTTLVGKLYDRAVVAIEKLCWNRLVPIEMRIEYLEKLRGEIDVFLVILREDLEG